MVVSFVVSGDLQIGSFSLADEINRLKIYSFGLTRLISSDDDSHPDVIGVTYNSDESHRMVYVDFDADPYLRWQSEPLDDGASYSYNHVISDPTKIYLAYETTLLAFDRADGTILWQQEISDEVANYCQDCLQIFDDWVLTLTADGVLAGYETQTGEAIWNVRLNETPRQLVNLGGKAGVLDDVEDATGIQVFDPETGSLLQQIVPECPNEIFPDSPQTMHIYDPILLSNDGQNLYLSVSNYDPGCLQKWDAATLTMEWEASIPDAVLGNLDWEPHLMTNQYLYLNGRNNIFAICLADGSYQTIYSNEDYSMTPLSENSHILLTQAQRTRGTTKYSLWGLDITTQSKEWEFTSTAGDIFDEDSFVVYADGAWGLSPGTADPVVLEAFTDPGTITFFVLETATGAIASENSLIVNNNDNSYWMQMIGGDGNHVYLIIDGQVWWVNAANGADLGVWP
jgi:outer membrane protein assembly factor BamB